MAELKKPVGKDAAANDDTNKPDQVDRNVTGAELFLDGACFDSSRLVGDLGDFLLKDLRVSRDLKPWSKMSEKEQEALIDRAEKQAQSIIAGVTRSVASHGIEHMEGMLEDKGSFGEGFFSIKVKVPMNAKNMLLLAKHDGEVQVVFSSPQKFQSTLMVRSQPDAPKLPGVADADAANKPAKDGDPAAGDGGAKSKAKPPKDKPEGAEPAPAAAPSA